MSTNKHPSSDGLRKLADWLDANPGLIEVNEIPVQLMNKTPDGFAKAVDALRAKVDDDRARRVVFVAAQLHGLDIRMCELREKVGQKVVRELPDFLVHGAVA